MITIEVQGHGSFVIPSNKLNELLNWLSSNSMPVETRNNSLNGDNTLLNG